MIKVPRNEDVLKEYGPYVSSISLGEDTTSTQRKMVSGLHGFEPGTQATLLTLVQLAMGQPVQFFDVGAHIGLHSLIVASIFPTASVKVTAFEPTPKTAAVCRALAAANNLQIRIERCAISDRDGVASLYISPWETSNSLVAGFRPARGTVQVPSLKLESYCTQRGVYPAVIKVDVESYESHVVAGARGVLARSRPSVVCEILRDTDPTAIGRTVDVFASLDYHAYRWTRVDGWRECTPREVIAQIPHDGNDWLFMPTRLDQRFESALAAWRTAIATCTGDKTVRVGRRSIWRPTYYQPGSPPENP